MSLIAIVLSLIMTYYFNSFKYIREFFYGKCDQLLGLLDRFPVFSGRKDLVKVLLFLLPLVGICAAVSCGMHMLGIIPSLLFNGFILLLSFGNTPLLGMLSPFSKEFEEKKEIINV